MQRFKAADGGKADQCRARKPPGRPAVDAAQGINGHGRHLGNAPQTHRAEWKAFRVALRCEGRAEKDGIERRPACCPCRVRRRRDDPARMQGAPMDSLRGFGFGQVDPVRADARGEIGVIGDEKLVPRRAGDAAQFRRELCAMRFLARAKHHHASTRQGARGGQGIGQPFVVRHQHKRGQGRTAARVQRSRRSCEFGAGKLVCRQ